MNKRFTSEDTLLHFAAGTDHPDVTNMLINAGAALDALNGEKNTPLMMALKNDHYITANRLIDKGADVKNANIKGETTLHFAAGTGHVDTVEILIDVNIELDAQDREGLTPLMIALQNDEKKNKEHDEKKNYQGVANLLIEKGADINKKNMKGETAFHFAAKTGRIDIVTKLVNALKKKQMDLNKKNNNNTINKQIEASAEVDAQDKNGWTPLMIAVQFGHNGIAEVLMNEKVDLNKKNKFGETALYHAAETGNFDATEKLLEGNADVDTKNKDGWTPLMISLKNQQINIANILTGNVDLIRKNINQKNKYGDTALHFAVKIEDKGIVKNLTEAGAALNTQNKNGWTPLMIAVKYRHTSIMEDLIKDLNFDLNQTTNKKETALHHAANAGNIDATTKLIAAGAEIYTQDENENTPLMIAVEKGYANVSEKLIKKTAGVQKQNKLGKKALHLAAKKGPIDVIKKLIGADVHLNAQTHEGRTPLMIAIENRNDDIASFLIEQNANENMEDNYGNTVLHFVAKTGSVAVLNKLKNPTKIDTPNHEGRTPLMIASQNGHQTIVEFLIEHRTNVATVDRFGNTALHLAAEGGHIETVKLLTDATADVKVKKNDGLTPLMIASRNGHDETVKVLIEKITGANNNIGTDMDKWDIFRKTSLHYAAEAGHADIAKKLIEAGATMNISDIKGMTPIMTAANSSAPNPEATVSVLLRCARAKTIAKKMLNKPRKDGMTALMFAVRNGQQDLVDALIKNGAEVDTQRKDDGINALLLAANNGQQTIVDALLEARAKVNAQRKDDGMTALMFAANNGQQTIVDALLEARAKVNAQRKDDGMTALMFAANNGHEKIVDALIKAGAEVNAQRESDGETALTLVREELVLIRLAQSSIQNDVVKFLKEETVREKLRDKQLAAEHKASDYVDVIEKECPNETLSEFEKDQLRKTFEEIPVYKTIREKLLKAGGYDVTNIKNPETKCASQIISYLLILIYFIHIVNRENKLLMLKFKFKIIISYLFYDRMKIKHILRWTEVKVLKDILKGAKEGNNYNAVSLMFKLLASDENLVTCKRN